LTKNKTRSGINVTKNNGIKKGIEAFITLSKEILTISVNTYKIIPNGGVSKSIIKLSTIIMPK